MRPMLINEEILRERCRNFSENMSFPRQIAPIVEEVEQLDIKGQLGDALYIDIIEDKTGRFKTLLEGGEYVDCMGNRRIFAGLYQAEAYYVYARMLRNPGGFLSSTGFRKSMDSYSSHVEYKERESTIIAVKEAADSYMRDCLDYLRENPELGYCRSNPKRERKHTMKVIGE